MNHIQKITLTAATLLLSIGVSAQERTQSSTLPKPTEATRAEWVPHVGLLGGVADPEGSYDATGEVGLDIGFQPYIPFGIGLEASYFESEGAANRLERTQVLAKGNYNFGGTTPVVRYSYIGLGVGAVFLNNRTALVSAPMVGFDIPLKQAADNFLSLGASAKYAFIEGSEPDALSVVGAVKYWY